LSGLSSKLQTGLREEVGLVDKVQQLETDKAALEVRVTQLTEEGAARGGVGTGEELEDSRREVSRLLLAVEEHKAAYAEVGQLILPLGFFRFFLRLAVLNCAVMTFFPAVIRPNFTLRCIHSFDHCLIFFFLFDLSITLKNPAFRSSSE
jgi:hypothetical protein